MPLFAGKTSKERYQTITALALGLVAVLFLGRMFFGSSQSPTANTNKPHPVKPNGPQPAPADGTQNEQALNYLSSDLSIKNVSFDGGDGGRNIFAFYEKPTPTPKDLNAPTPTPTPTPTPPLTL